tara:strand:- start:48 stop:314 length:267 start_codon:yes stop_codon:yes gene_type:complete
VVKKVFSTFLLIGLLFPIITEAGVFPEGNPNRPKNHFPEGRPRKRKKCKRGQGVVVCTVPKRKKCTIKRPCIPKGYYRKNPPRIIPMG